MEKVHKSPESPKAIEKLESFADQAPGNIQNVTPNMPPIDTPLLYRKDNLDGHSSNVCTDDRIFHEEVLFLRRELDNKQKTIDSLLNIINYMHTNSNKSGENIYKNTNAHPIQINGTAEEQGNNNLTAEDNTYKDISRNQTQSEEHRNEELQKHPDIENRSIITIENQLTEFRKKHQEKFTQIKKPHILPNSNEKLQKWDRNTTLIVGDSMLSGIEERRIAKRNRKVKVKNFPGATIDDMYDYIKPLLKKCPDNIILHVGTNNTVNEPSKIVLGKLLDLKKFIEHTLPESNVVISNLITRIDNGKASLTVTKTNEHLHGLQMDIIDNGNITSNELNKGGLHLNPRGLGKLAINFIRRIKKFATT